MSPEEIAAQQEMNARQMALGMALQRAKPEDSLDDIIKMAEKLMAFLKAGLKVA